MALISVYPLPALAAPEELAGGAAVAIDVLRASTTINYALAAGAREIIPCQQVEEARKIAAAFSPGEVLLGGERLGVRIEGFDLGNSPAEYTAQRVAGKLIVFTTTNGTQAIHRCRLASRILIGAFVNAAAVVERLAAEERVFLVCAGTRGEITREDLLLAGLLVQRLQSRGRLDYQLNAPATAARDAWQAAFPPEAGSEPISPQRLAGELRNSPGGRNVLAIGLDEDILAAARLDLFSGVPQCSGGADQVRIRLP